MVLRSKAGASWQQQSKSIPAPVEDNFTDEEKQSFEDMYSKALDFMNKDEPVDSEPVYKWVKVKDELPDKEDDYFVRSGEDKNVFYFNGKRFETYEYKKTNFEWLKEINQPVEDKDITLTYKNYCAQGRTLNEAVQLLGEIIENKSVEDAHEAFLEGQTVMYKAMKAEDKLQNAIAWCDEKIRENFTNPLDDHYYEEMKQYLESIK